MNFLTIDEMRNNKQHLNVIHPLHDRKMACMSSYTYEKSSENHKEKHQFFLKFIY